MEIGGGIRVQLSAAKFLNVVKWWYAWYVVCVCVCERFKAPPCVRTNTHQPHTNNTHTTHTNNTHNNQTHNHHTTTPTHTPHNITHHTNTHTNITLYPHCFPACVERVNMVAVPRCRSPRSSMPVATKPTPSPARSFIK